LNEGLSTFSSMEQEGVSIKVAGALKGAVRVASFDVAAGELRAEVARLLGEQAGQAADHTAWSPMQCIAQHMQPAPAATDTAARCSCRRQ
jgi:hypothetical protein